MLFELIGRQAKFVNNFAFIIRLQNLWQHPRFEVDAVCDGVKLDFVVIAIAKICHARVQFTNAIFGFGEFDGQQVWSQAVVAELFHQPAAHGITLDVWQD